jgi:hypothetical protein
MWVSDGWGSLVNRGNRGEHSFRTAADRHRFPGSVSELHGSGMAAGAGPIRRRDRTPTFPARSQYGVAKRYPGS